MLHCSRVMYKETIQKTEFIRKRNRHDFSVEKTGFFASTHNFSTVSPASRSRGASPAPFQALVRGRGQTGINA